MIGYSCHEHEKILHKGLLTIYFYKSVNETRKILACIGKNLCSIFMNKPGIQQRGVIRYHSWDKTGSERA
jgi:hypothetical protein